MSLRTPPYWDVPGVQGLNHLPASLFSTLLDKEYPLKTLLHQRRWWGDKSFRSCPER
jgi:hypothetical protein